MADIDISVGELPEAEYFDGESILLVENQGIAERVSGAQIKGFLRSGDSGGGGSGGGVSKASELDNDVPFVSAGEQSLTDEQKAKARTNIGAATVDIEYQNIGSASFVLFDITDGNGKGHHLEWSQDPMKPKDGGVWVPQFNEETSMLEWDYYQADELYPVPMPTPVGIPIPNKTSDLENDSEFVELPTMQQSIQQVYDTTNVFIPQTPTEEQKAQARENIGVENVLESVGGDTLEWDGNTDGLVSVDDYFFKVSDIVPTIDDFKNGVIIDSEANPDGPEEVTPENIVSFGDGVIIIRVAIAIIPKNAVGLDLEGLVFPEAGIYMMNQYGNSISLTIPGYTGFVKKKIKEEYIPESVPNIQTAAVGQTIVVSEVDSEGKPTKWEAAEFPAGGEKPWTLIGTVDVTADISAGIYNWTFTDLEYKELWFTYKNMVGSTSSVSGISVTINGVSTSQQCVKTSQNSNANGANGWTYAFIGPSGFCAVFGAAANSPTNYASNGLVANMNPVPLNGVDTIHTLYLWGNMLHMPVSGVFEVYGR